MTAQTNPPVRFTADCVRENDQLVVRFSGRLVRGPRNVPPDWRSCLEHSTMFRDVAVDLGGVTDIDASGIGLLAELTAVSQRSGRRVAVVSANSRVRRLLSLTRLDTAIDGGVRNPGPKMAA